MRKLIILICVTALLFSCGKEQDLPIPNSEDKSSLINARINSFDTKEAAIDYIVQSKGLSKSYIEHKIKEQGIDEKKGTDSSLTCKTCDIQQAVEFCEYIDAVPHYFFLLRVITPKSKEGSKNKVYVGFDGMMTDWDGNYLEGLSQAKTLSGCIGAYVVIDHTFGKNLNPTVYFSSFFISNSLSGVYLGEWGTQYFYPNTAANNTAICDKTPVIQGQDLCQ